MSALPPKGGIRLCEWHVRFVSIADMMHVRDTLMKRYELCEVVVACGRPPWSAHLWAEC
jgi:hypothetical protein